jgi:hypothetical protein
VLRRMAASISSGMSANVMTAGLAARAAQRPGEGALTVVRHCGGRRQASASMECDFAGMEADGMLKPGAPSAKLLSSCMRQAQAEQQADGLRKRYKFVAADASR